MTIAERRKEIAQIKSVRNTSGTVGVRMSVEVDRRGPEELVYTYWVAQWSPEPGVRKTRRFSINKHGDAKAFKLAVKARRDGRMMFYSLDDAHVRMLLDLSREHLRHSNGGD